MNFLLTDEHTQFKDLLSDFFTDRFGGEKLKKYTLENRKAGDWNLLESHWKDFCELGALGGGVPEDKGGLGLGFLSHIILVLEAAKVLSPLPILETICFGILPLEFCAGEPAVQTEMSELLTGKRVAAGSIGTNFITEFGESFYFENESKFFKSAISDSKFTENSGAELVRSSRTFKRSEDKTLLGTITEQRNLELSRLLLVAAELVAVASTATALTLEFVKTRKQFGVQIGTFQAVQHKFADIKVQLDAAESLLYFAGWAKDKSVGQFEEAALSSFIFSKQVSKTIIEQCLQLHGGMGFTWECPIHLYLRRSLAVSLWFNDSDKLSVNLAELENTSAVS
jgi:alkylation response protein AidB-like acyl-CoA dehydrogenase